ncbi:MAG: DUF4139 domain-containing protein [Bacteroidales bacterium]|nr:DUF4139 domain-containing protein [Bacteroidales bacterium]
MRTTIFTLLICILQFTIYSQEISRQELSPDVSSVVVYTEGVEVSHNVDVRLAAGRNLLVFKGLSSKIQTRSLRVNADVEMSVLSINHKIDYLTEQNEKPRARQVRDSLRLINASITLLQNESDALSIQKELLLNNRHIGGTENGTNVLELQKAADFFQTRIFEINKRQSKISLDVEDLNLVREKLNSELGELNSASNYERSEIAVLLTTDRAITKRIELRYYISDAGWAPIYEIKAEDIDKPLKLYYRARVFNNTEIDWSNIDMMLSTADPNMSVNYPVLLPWKLNFIGSATSIADMNPYQANLNDNYVRQREQQLRNVQQRGAVSFVPISVSEVGIDLPLNTKYSVPCDSKPYIVDVAEYNLPATYRHICVPKMNKGVFLLAQIVDWEDLNLVEGEANVYLAETYVGKSYIYTRGVSDTLNLSLGYDKKVVVTRTKVKNYTSRQFLGTKVKETIRYQFEVKNNRSVPIDIEIMDQVPVSENSEIEVSVDETSGAEHAVLSGILNWRFNLAEGSKKEFFMQYTVRYPRNQRVETAGKAHRTINAPSF